MDLDNVDEKLLAQYAKLVLQLEAIQYEINKIKSKIASQVNKKEKEE